MARYTGADCKRCRREKMKLFLKGAKCDTPKCPIEIRPYPPGEHGRGRTKDSEYLLQMREKQKCARIYGVLEKQFRRYYEEANRRPGKTGENLLQLLERRLDRIVLGDLGHGFGHRFGHRVDGLGFIGHAGLFGAGTARVKAAGANVLKWRERRR